MTPLMQEFEQSHHLEVNEKPGLLEMLQKFIQISCVPPSSTGEDLLSNPLHFHVIQLLRVGPSSHKSLIHSRPELLLC